MRQDKLSKQNVILYLCGIIPVVWLGLLIAPCLKDGLPGLVQQFGSVMQNPFQIQLCEDSVKTVLTLLLVYGIAIGVYLSTEHNYRRREEHGSAKWGAAGSVNKKYANKDKTENKLLTQNVAIGLDGRKHRRNLNVLVCGGSGAGKTRFYAKPNIMNANTSFVVLDPKGELLRDTGKAIATTHSCISAAMTTFSGLPQTSSKTQRPKVRRHRTRSGIRRQPCCSRPLFAISIMRLRPMNRTSPWLWR